MAKKNEMEKAPAAQLTQAKAADLLPEDVDFDELLENLAEMDEVEFPRISHKNGKFFFSDDPSDKGTEEFEGIVLYYGKQNTYWEGTYDPKNITPPECYSVDGVTGSKPRDENGRFGRCDECELNKFGSGKGKGKACRNQTKLYIQKIGTTVPMVLFLPPTSIRAFESNYIIHKVTQRGLTYPKIVTKFTSFQAQNETFYRINFEISGVYKGEDAQAVKKFRDYWLKAIKKDRNRLDSMVSQHDHTDTTPAPSPAPSSAQTRVVDSKPATSQVVGIIEDDDMPF